MIWPDKEWAELGFVPPSELLIVGAKSHPQKFEKDSQNL